MKTIKFLSPKRIIYLIVIIFSVLFIIFGNYIATKDLQNQDITQERVEKARVIEITELKLVAESGNLEDGNYYDVYFKAKILSGYDKDLIVDVVQHNDPLYASKKSMVKVDDEILIHQLTNGDLEDIESSWFAGEPLRSNNLIVLAVVFILLLIIFGKSKGVNTIISLVFTCLAIFVVFIPSVLAGKNIYLWSSLTCVFITFMTLLIVNGLNKKSIVAIIGCLSGTAIAGVLTLVMNSVLKLTGFIDEDAMYLSFMGAENPIDLKAVIFAAIIIGAIGAIMDVSISISSSLWELKQNVTDIDFYTLFKSGITIGRDIMGTMANTLILAYIGSSLSVVLLLFAFNNSLLMLFNSEMIVVEILQALVGSFGILFVLPFTSIIAAFVFTKPFNKIFNRKHENKEGDNLNEQF